MQTSKAQVQLEPSEKHNGSDATLIFEKPKIDRIGSHDKVNSKDHKLHCVCSKLFERARIWRIASCYLFGTRGNPIRGTPKVSTLDIQLTTKTSDSAPYIQKKHPIGRTQFESRLAHSERFRWCQKTWIQSKHPTARSLPKIIHCIVSIRMCLEEFGSEAPLCVSYSGQGVGLFGEHTNHQLGTSNWQPKIVIPLNTFKKNTLFGELKASRVWPIRDGSVHVQKPKSTLRISQQDQFTRS